MVENINPVPVVSKKTNLKVILPFSLLILLLIISILINIYLFSSRQQLSMANISSSVSSSSVSSIASVSSQSSTSSVNSQDLPSISVTSSNSNNGPITYNSKYFPFIISLPKGWSIKEEYNTGIPSPSFTLSKQGFSFSYYVGMGDVFSENCVFPDNTVKYNDNTYGDGWNLTGSEKFSSYDEVVGKTFTFRIGVPKPADMKDYLFICNKKEDGNWTGALNVMPTTGVSNYAYGFGSLNASVKENTVLYDEIKYILKNLTVIK